MRLAQSRDISIEWTCLLMKSVGLWLAADQAEQRRRNAALIYTINAISIATCIAFRDIYFSWGNISDCVFIMCNILYLMIVLFKIAVLYMHRAEFYELVRYTQKKFWHSDYSYEEKLIMDDCKRMSGIFIIVLSFCAQGTCAGYMVTPLIERRSVYVSANIGKNDTDRLLPFNMWVSFPTGKSPYFETLFTIQVLLFFFILSDDNVLFLSLIICLVGYQLFLTQADTPSSRNVSLIMNLMGTLCQLFMFTYSCDGIIQQSSDVSKAILFGPWSTMPMDKAGRNLRKIVLLMILRSSRSCCLTASGFFPISLETYTGVLSTAMSYFTLLRQQTVGRV
ncbi:uncharacterized protein LOC143219266 [Lasioglossum baleicum]|uniref:uncharacterized protein LOC143219266 n=1 Tax=Lasioglossum baleicum TaxID=434251 RepID=UPI003FCD4C09